MPLGYALKWPLASWMLTCLILANAYSGLYYSLLTIPETEPFIDTIEDFLDYITINKDVQLVSSTYTGQIFSQTEQSENVLYYRIRQRFNG